MLRAPRPRDESLKTSLDLDAVVFDGDRDLRAALLADKRFVRKDGRSLWISRTVALGRDAANEAPYLIHVFEDITERKRTQAQLERLRRTREVLASCNRALVHAVEEAAMLEQVCRIAVKSGGFKQAWIGLVTGDALRPLAVAAHAGYENDAPPMSSPFSRAPEKVPKNVSVWSPVVFARTSVTPSVAETTV